MPGLPTAGPEKPKLLPVEVEAVGIKFKEVPAQEVPLELVALALK